MRQLIPQLVSKTMKWLAAVVIILMFASGAKADWINLTGAETANNIAEIKVTDEGVSVALEIFPDDVKHFADILPDEAFGDDPPDRPSQSERWARFSHDGVRVETGEGTVLPVEVRLIEPRKRKDRASPFAGMTNPQTGAPIPGAPEDKRVIFAELFYPFESKPDRLLISPPMNDDGGAAVTIGFIAYHTSIPIIDFRFLSGTATLNLNWGDPWYSKFDSPNLKRHHKDALMGFLYVEPRAVRVEGLVRLRDLAQWVDLGIDEGAVVEPDRQEAILAKAAEFFSGTNSVTADGDKLVPTDSRASFVEIATTGINVVEEPKPMDYSSALAGIVTTYNIDHMPKKVLLDWQLFDERQEKVNVTLYDPAGPFLSYATSEERTVEWENFLKTYSEPSADRVPAGKYSQIVIPLASVLLAILALCAGLIAMLSQKRRRVGLGVCVASAIGAAMVFPYAHTVMANPFAGQPESEELAIVTQQLMENLYVALSEHATDKRELALETSAISGKALEIEDEAERGLVVGLAGGSQARSYDLTEMKIRNVVATDSPGGVSAVANWTANVSGGHWGHVHQRAVEFEALVEMVPESGDWKLDGLTITSRN